MAASASALADEILARHSARYGVDMPRVQVVLADGEDDPNGFASPLPYPLVWIRAAAPDGSDEFGNYETWLRQILTHELAHTVHLEEANGVLGFGRKVFGRAPFLFPNTLTPTWMIEGLATYEETAATAFGRGRSPDSAMLVRGAILEGKPPLKDQAVLGLDAWPGGLAPYFYGEAFLRYETARYGEATLPALARKQSRRVVPYFDDLTAKNVTGQSFGAAWRDWVDEERAAANALRSKVAAEGQTEARALTTRGIRQEGPRVSPDGTQVAYTSATLDRFPEIRMVGIDGTGDRRICARNGGSGLSFTPDGRFLVFDETEVAGTFEHRSDLRRVEIASGRVTLLTRGVRASTPDVSADGRTVFFAHRHADRTEIGAIAMTGGAITEVTDSPPATRWSAPRASPDGRSLVAARWSPGSLLDIVLLDLASGAMKTLTNDRAQDVEPSFTPDGSEVVFRSSRDGVPNIYKVAVTGGPLQRVTNVVGGAFSPSISPDGKTLVFAGYSGAGYDIETTAFTRGQPAPEFADTYAVSRADPSSEARTAPYRPFHELLPRFWSPFVEVDDGEWKVGALTAAADPLLRHAYGVEVHRGFETERFGARGFYRYDRWRPTILLVAEDDTSGSGIVANTSVRTRSLSVRATTPIVRRVRWETAITAGLRGERQSVIDSRERSVRLGGLAANLVYTSLKRYPWSISAQDGVQAQVSVLHEARAFGSDLSLTRLNADLRGYARVAGNAVLAMTAGAGTTFGEPRFFDSFAAGGFVDAGLFDVGRVRPSVLRGFDGGALTGRDLAYANAELRVPLAHPQRGIRSLPIFVRHIHAAAFLDSAIAWHGFPVSGPADFDWHDAAVSAGAQIGADLMVFHVVPMTLAGGYAVPLRKGSAGPFAGSRFYLNAGLAF